MSDTKTKSLLLILLIGSAAFAVLGQAQTNSKQNDQLSAAKKQLEECQNIYRSGGPDAAARALVKGLDAQQLFASAGDKSGEAFSLSWIGYLYGELGSRPKAIEAYAKAVALFHGLGDGRNEADTLNSLGYVYILENQQEKGFNALNEALALYRKLGDKIREASTLSTFALAYEHLADVPKAVSYYDQGMSASHAVGDTRGEATVQFLSGSLLSRNRESVKAIDRLQAAFASFRLLNDKKWEAITLVAIGRVYKDSGNSVKALENFLQALPLVHETADKETEAGLLKRIAEVYERMGDSAKASEYYERSSSIQQSPESKAGAQSPNQLSTLPNPAPAINTKPSNQSESAQQGNADPKQTLAEARKLLVEGIALFKQGTEESLRAALEKAVQARLLFHQSGDRSGEAFTLHGLGYLYRVIGKPTKALAYFQEALVLRREGGDKRGEAITDINLGVLSGNLGNRVKELAYYQESLSLYRSVGEKDGAAGALSSIGSVFDDRGETDKALEYYQQALALYREVGDKSGEADTLAFIGGVFSSLGEKTKALQYFQNSLSLFRANNEGTTQAKGKDALDGISSNYADLNEQQRALEYFHLDIVLAPLVEDKQGEAGILNSIGRIHQQLGEQGKSLDYYQQALAVYRTVGNRSGIALTLDSIGSAYGSWGDSAKAIEYGNQALSIFREAEDKGGEAMELNNVAVQYGAAGDKRKAFEYYQQSLLLDRKLENKRNVAVTLSNLMWLSRESNDLPGAIFYGKQAINVYQELRFNIRNIERKLQLTYVKSIEGNYRLLADLLITQGRLPEAQQVLDLLKEQEYFEFVRRDASEVSSLNGRATLTPEEATLEKRYREIADRLTSLGAERAELVNKLNRTPEEEKHLAQLDKDIVGGNTVFQKFLVQLTQELTRPKQIARLEQIEESEGLMDTLRRLGPGTVALYTLVGEEKYRVILVTADVRKAYEYPIKAADLNRKVLAFREVLQTPGLDPRPMASEMYKVLIGPDLAHDLAQANAQTLMWSLDGVLRYVPMATLYDGQRYLVESYRNVIFTPASHSRLNNPVTAKWRALGLGVSKAHEGFVALTGVPAELSGIIQDKTTKGFSTGVLPGSVIIDEAFTETAMEAGLRVSYPVVHIASHFSFQPGNETQSFLLLGDGTHLTLAELKNLGQLFSGVDLLTLSACNTAIGSQIGDGKELESFGVIAQKKGANAVMATLWPVMDESTQLFMREFYRLHGSRPNITKGDALREAQLALLRGQIRGSALNGAGRNSSRGTGDIAGQPRFETDPKAPFAHPYFWAPFILIGNWK